MIESFGNFRRDKYCGEVSSEDVGKELRLCGWVHRVRDHGGVIFIDLRDREGIVQVVAEEGSEVYEKAERIKSEWVVGVRGEVRKRPPGTENPNLRTGSVEVVAKEIKIFNTSDLVPFPVEEDASVSEELKLRYRYIDLRRPFMRENILFRHRLYQAVRKFLTDRGFVEIETPFLTKSTPEGARDFLVPSRLHPGKFYALPQSPQLFKQVLMVSGFDRYFQIVKCFRDEDLRADRQPEFTQIDYEMSFVGEEEVMEVAESLLRYLFGELLNVELPSPLDRISLEEALERYGSDKPDRRFGLELIDLTGIFRETEFKVFKRAVEEGGVVKAINFKGGNLSRKEIDELVSFAQNRGAGGLAWIKVEAGKLSSPIVKFLARGEIEALLKAVDAHEGDVILFSAGGRELVNKILGDLRLYIAKRYKLAKGWDALWVVDFPLMEWDEEEGRFVALHHPFTAPKESDAPLLFEAVKTEDLEEKKRLVSSTRARAYDLILNGEEVGGGSIRIHTTKLQETVFKLLGIGEEEAREKFGFLLDALRFGAPPHGGFAFGLDRLVALMRGLDSIRDVIAFPKTQKGICMLSGAPADVTQEQLKEVHIKI